MDDWFGKDLQGWYEKNKRDLPWRQTKDPYKIWLSEIILQQTRVAQGLSYYYRFIENYPTVKDLALASEDKVLKDWQGLGYYSRARNLQAAALHILNVHSGNFPTEYHQILELKGVGVYTAAAICSFAFGKAYAVVDGNVYRVLSRVFGIETPQDSTLGKKQFQDLATSLLDQNNPGNFNQAIMEFGSQYCKPVKPDCNNCIFRSKCFAASNNLTDALPVKEKKTKVRQRYFSYLVILDPKKKLAIRKRVAGDIWQGLYEFPLIESTHQLTRDQVFSSNELKQLAGSHFSLRGESRVYKHLLSHQQLIARFYILETDRVLKGITCTKKTIAGFAFPRLIQKFIDDYTSESTALF
jgi:A/G-specific adenine glycosylase